ncbi:hypothetical protein HGG64_02840 [Mycoplasma phocoeninasale]|uniref:Uncharacterized protein n=1 Tax=Mycoplasma phocoeninasale TaxID=2726117 RepID=A0A858U3J8_9MOLU|nr:hypothetical protein [Mycoplasma phocoeninasale]QJG66619.1 hypothetical protein HGG64_02840 [Mycoplasma phocoeninasale]
MISKKEDAKPLGPINLNKDQIDEVISLIRLDKNKPISLNLENFKNTSSSKIQIKNIKILKFNDLTGEILLSIDGLFENREFSIKESKITDFRKIIISTTTNIDASINKNNLIENLKNIDDLKNLEESEILKYIDIKYNNVLINDLHKKNLAKIKSITFIRGSLSLDFSFNYKTKELNEQEKSYTAEIKQNRILVKNLKSVNAKEVLDYILEEQKVNISSINLRTFASIYKSKWNTDKTIINYFFDRPQYNEIKNKYLGGNGDFSLDIVEVKSNDLTGTLFLSYRVSYEHNDQTIMSMNTKNENITGFLKIKDNDIFKDYGKRFLLINDIFNNLFKKTLENLYKEQYLKKSVDKGTNELEISDDIIQYFKFERWDVFKRSSNGYDLKGKYSFWLFKHDGLDLAIKKLKKDTILEEPLTHKELLIIEGIFIEPVKINMTLVEDDKRFNVNFKYKITFILNSDNDIFSDNYEKIEVMESTNLFLNI